ncbi:D-alanyl-D-alanine carboxypeptidase [Paenibacillus baekrokdamisoli]|uniref:D-alanyl-D-alanine carboxypeptidase n=1 Tax=Paenibacillus baekrokdamisoli TaxID=1712516 RepID=A0A3G9JGU4_9BACL|nr:M15 family metallopeptidase [Paenibacillus baekrokdamisoli]MBB3070843.1 D-alanyl-D-alanine carboxypeptidase [Paenibacillus baekrokdamisoli]BBH22219.1 D-alanyl-D-alanine carboxypeptidase [Paenibacillus baekrokdamisoli]
MKKKTPIISFILLGLTGFSLVFFATDLHPSEVSASASASSVSAVSSTQTSSQIAFTKFMHTNAPSLTIKKNSAGIAMVTNTSSTIILVNKKRELASTYKPSDLVKPNIPFSFAGDSPKKLMRKPAATAIENLFAGAKKANISLKGVSAYRSYATQKAIFDRNAALKGAAVANKTSAHPGQSEHQTGLAIDVSSSSVNYALEQSLGKTKEGKWLKAHAAEYGFIVRYGEGQEKLTGYTYEPWHLRYVGVYIAQEITKQGLTLEQYLMKY